MRHGIAVAVLLATGCSSGFSQADIDEAVAEALAEQAAQAAQAAATTAAPATTTESPPHECLELFKRDWNAYGWEKCLDIEKGHISSYRQAERILSDLANAYSGWQHRPALITRDSHGRDRYLEFCGEVLDGAAATVTEMGTRVICFHSRIDEHALIHEFVHHLVGLDDDHGMRFRCAALAIYAERNLVGDVADLLETC